MSALRSVWPNATGLVFEVADDRGGTFDVDLDGRRVWSFKNPGTGVPPEWQPAGVPVERLRFQPWPERLRQRLTGSFRVRIRHSGAAEGPEAVLRIGADGPLRLVDRHDRPLVVNKWDRLGRALVDAPAGQVDRMLDSLDAIRAVVEAQLGPVVTITCGTLLGAVRENGHVLPHDDDADLAYLSRWQHPADVARESFRLGRVLRAAGFEVLRLSVGHLQVVVEHEGVTDHYVDVFPSFLMDGWYHHYFMVRTPLADATPLLPTTPLTVEGRTEPAPAQPEFLLEQVYGPGWRSPDPSFAFEIPPSTGQRFYGWFADYNVERESWEALVELAAPGEMTGAGVGLSAFARDVHARTPEGSALLELGSGLGADAVALVEAGRTVRAVDFSRYMLRAARELAAERGVDVPFTALNLLDTGAVVRLGAELAARPEQWTVFGRRLLNALEDRGRDNLFRLCSMLLRDGTAAHFDVVADHGYAGIAPHRHLTLPQVVAEAEARGLVLDEATPCTEPMTWFDAPDEELVPLSRLTFRRRRR
ncbi:class I SAM-dependent methyltransferase [Blastococcus sp. TF02A-35]|uniref:class I SAM-dependent methyltransferase n=1 Tax=Blastococcus sp. TF02A-35 TaxID=2559612 RepID=UPI001073ACD5|nr:class I SAM-dependent methyltransferase [Blastococcus sp. TF02A_35]TFV53589.1 class I SAM-dependent methyltransferase [Blastococcus sp. TF02A_35]